MVRSYHETSWHFTSTCLEECIKSKLKKKKKKRTTLKRICEKIVTACLQKHLIYIEEVILGGNSWWKLTQTTYIFTPLCPSLETDQPQLKHKHLKNTLQDAAGGQTHEQQIRACKTQQTPTHSRLQNAPTPRAIKQNYSMCYIRYFRNIQKFIVPFSNVC